MTTDDRVRVTAESEERADRNTALQSQIAAERDHSDQPELRYHCHRGGELRIDLRRSHSLGEQSASERLQAIHHAFFLAEPLDDADAGNRLLDVLREVGCPLLGGPGGCIERGPQPVHHEGHCRNDEQCDDGEQRRQVGHHTECQYELHECARGQRNHGEQTLHELEVGDGSGDDLAGPDLVLFTAVEALQGGEKREPQVVLDVDGQSSR